MDVNPADELGENFQVLEVRAEYFYEGERSVLYHVISLKI